MEQFNDPMMRWLSKVTGGNRAKAVSLWLLLAGCVLLALLGLWLSRPDESAVGGLQKASVDVTSPGGAIGPGAMVPPLKPIGRPAPLPTSEEIVSRKLAQFAQSRQQLAQTLARRHGVALSAEVGDFFQAVESGDWDQIELRFKVINGGDSSAGHAASRPPEVTHLWPAIIDAYGAAEQVHLLPAPQLLEYGQAILDSLRPGMVYVGGSDAGRWVPELLNETSDGERHIVITQNGLADSTYLDYLRVQYDDQLANLTEEDAKRSFQEYITDAQKRLEHDQKYPNETRQLRPGEDVRLVDGKIEVSGQVAVMAINEKLLQQLMQKNPSVSFGLQESFPLTSTYPGAVPLGPIMELGPADGQSSFTAQEANQTVADWERRTEQLRGQLEAHPSPESLKNFSHDIGATANLLAAHNFDEAAEKAYRLSNQLWPANPESVAALSDLLNRRGRTEESQRLLHDFANQYPDQVQALKRAGTDMTFLVSQQQNPASP